MEEKEKTPMTSDSLFKRVIADILDSIEKKIDLSELIEEERAIVFPFIESWIIQNKALIKKKLWNLSDDLKAYKLLINPGSSHDTKKTNP